MNSNKESTGAKPFFPLTQTPVASPTPIYAMTFQKSHLTELLRHFDKPFFPWGKKFKKKKKSILEEETITKMYLWTPLLSVKFFRLKGNF